ncbi:MAG: tetratricopeptide repeat protein [Marinobacterium sp.]|nr:tetratricopeptide repeat protein [Marinobacterium sp.]
MKLTPLIALCSTLLLGGCSLMENRQKIAVTPLPAPEYVPGELNHESLYELLKAELSGQRGLFPQALEGYLQQARLTGDAGVAERATRVAQYMRRPDAVMEATRLWQQAAPDNAEPYQIEASILLHKGHFEDALPLLRQALRNNQRQTLALIESRVAQMPDEILSAYQALIIEQLSMQPDNAELYRSNGVLLRRQGKLNQALQAFNQALKASPKKLDVLVHKADLLRATNQTRQALKTVAHGLKYWPDNRQLRLQSIQLQFDSQQPEQATRDAKKMISETARDYPLHLYLALLMMDADKLDDAEQVLETLLDQNPSDSTPEFYLGHLAQKRGQRDNALHHFLGVSGGEKLYPAFSRIAALLDSAEHQQRLQEITTDGRALYPEIAQQLFALEAEWLHLYDLTDSALAVLEDALQLYPQEITLLYTRAMLIEGSDFPQAEQDLRTILTLEPDHAMSLNALGYLLSIHTDRLEEARQLISRALTLTPDDPATLDSMGWVLYRLGQAEASLPYLERAYDLLQDPEVISHLVEVYAALGQGKQARTLLVESLKQNPDATALQDVAEKLSMTPEEIEAITGANDTTTDNETARTAPAPVQTETDEAGAQ